MNILGMLLAKMFFEGNIVLSEVNDILVIFPNIPLWISCDEMKMFVGSSGLLKTTPRLAAMSQLETSASGISDRLRLIDDYQTHHRLREATGRKRAEELNERVMLWSLGQTCVILLIGVAQVILSIFCALKRWGRATGLLKTTLFPFNTLKAPEAVGRQGDVEWHLWTNITFSEVRLIVGIVKTRLFCHSFCLSNAITEIIWLKFSVWTLTDVTRDSCPSFFRPVDFLILSFYSNLIFSISLIVGLCLSQYGAVPRWAQL